MTKLRICAIVASSAAIYYGAFFTNEILWIPVFWNSLFLLTNLTQLLLIKWRTRDSTLDPLETFLSKTVLANFPTAEVKSFAAIAQEGNLASGKCFIRQGSKLGQLFCLIDGRVNIVKNGKKVAELTTGYFIGEMSFLTQTETKADVIAATDLRLLVWPHEEIEKWVNSDAVRLGLLNSALGTQVVDQLLRQNEELIEEASKRNTA